MSKTTFIAIVLFLGVAFLITMKETKSNSDVVILKETSVILAFGDSLTYGFGVNQASSYPAQIENKTGLKIINAGINGELSSEGLLRLPSLLKHKPDLVILCHGGNDIIQKLPVTQIKENLLLMIQLIQESGAKVLLIGVPDFALFNFDTHDLYEEVAQETGVLFEDEVLTHIGRKRSLKSDYVHPNAKGYEAMADRFIEVLNLP